MATNSHHTSTPVTLGPMTDMYVLPSLLHLPRSTSNIVSSTRNQIHSPLLRLPGELRNRIYRFALSGHIIVINGEWTKSPSWGSSCRLKSLLYVTSHAGERNNPTVLTDDHEGERDNPIVIKENYEDQRGSCCGRVADAFVLGRVSRQFHAETALLPYATNTFYFKDKWYLRYFVDKLSSAQAEAIATIALDPNGQLLVTPTSPNSSWLGAMPLWLPRFKSVYIAPNHHDMFQWRMSRYDKRKLDALEDMAVVRSVHRGGLYMYCFDVFDARADLGQATKVRVRYIDEKPQGT
jgi:hypothetical protein